MPSFVIKTGSVKIEMMEPGETRSAETRVFWSSNGFAFETPGKHAVGVRIVWGYGGVPYGVKASTELWVNYPQTRGDNDAASQLLHPEVGKLVALGGGADHLTEAVRRIEEVHDIECGAEGEAPACLRGYKGLLKAPKKLEKVPAGHDGHGNHKAAKKART